MSTNLATSPHTYRQSAILTASKERLVVMLYDGACRFLGQAAVAMRAGDVATYHNRLRRAESIIAHLQNTLDLEQGEVAENLLSIYLFCRRHLNEGWAAKDPGKIDDVRRLLSQLRESWNAICAAQ
jgi:flagellar secretion chaperone FliS